MVSKILLLPLAIDLSVVNTYIVYSSDIVFIITGIITLLFYARGRRKGFIFLGTGLLLVGIERPLLDILFATFRNSFTLQVLITFIVAISSFISGIIILIGIILLRNSQRNNRISKSEKVAEHEPVDT